MSAYSDQHKNYFNYVPQGLRWLGHQGNQVLDSPGELIVHTIPDYLRSQQNKDQSLSPNRSSGTILGGRQGRGRTVPATMGPITPLKPKAAKAFRKKVDKKLKKQADAAAVKKWNDALAANERARLAAEKDAADKAKQNNGGGNNGGGNNGSGGSSIPLTHSNWDLIGQQALGRMNPIYDSLEQRNTLLNSQRANTSTEQQTQFAAENAQRYAQMQQAMGTGYQDATTRASGDLNLQALQNASAQQDQYSRRMQEMNTMNAMDNTNAIAQARAAQSTNIQGAVIDARAAEAAANANAAASNAASSAKTGGDFGPGSWNYAQDLASGAMDSPYENLINTTRFNNNQPRLQQILGQLLHGDNPTALLSRVGAGPSGAARRTFLTEAQRLYNQRQTPTNEMTMQQYNTVQAGRGYRVGQ